MNPSPVTPEALSEMTKQERQKILRVLSVQAQQNPLIAFMLSEFKFNEKNSKGRVTSEAMNNYLENAKKAKFDTEKLGEIKTRILEADCSKLTDSGLLYKAHMFKSEIEESMQPHYEAEPFDVVKLAEQFINSPENVKYADAWSIMINLAQQVKENSAMLPLAQEVKRLYPITAKELMSKPCESHEQKQEFHYVASALDQSYKQFADFIPDPEPISYPAHFPEQGMHMTKDIREQKMPRFLRPTSKLQK